MSIIHQRRRRRLDVHYGNAGRGRTQGIGRNPDDFKAWRDTQRGWYIDHTTGLRRYDVCHQI